MVRDLWPCCVDRRVGAVRARGLCPRRAGTTSSPAVSGGRTAAGWRSSSATSPQASAPRRPAGKARSVSGRCRRRRGSAASNSTAPAIPRSRPRNTSNCTACRETCPVSSRMTNGSALVHPEDRARIEAETQGRGRRSRPHQLDYEFRIVRADNGEMRWVTARTKLIRDDEGPLPPLARGAVGRDRGKGCGSRRCAKSEERYRSFITHSSEGIWLLEFDPPLDTSLPVEEQVELAYRNGRFVDCNDAMARMYGLAHAEDLIGKTLEFPLPSSDPGGESLPRRGRPQRVQSDWRGIGRAGCGRKPQVFRQQHDRDRRGRRADAGFGESSATLRNASRPKNSVRF